MSTLGNNLFAQYYAQNQFKYIDNPELWLEADSWGTSVWTNKGNGGYDLACTGANTGIHVDNKIVASASNKVGYGILRNVLGTGSFTIEAVLHPNASMLSTTYGGWLVTARTNTLAQANSVQIFFNTSGVFGFSGWDSYGNSISFRPYLYYDTTSIGYYAVVCDVELGVLCKQVNSQSLYNAHNFSCLIDKFFIGNSNAFGTSLSTANPEAFYGDIYSIRVYRRALSEAERANNMRRDKARFNF